MNTIKITVEIEIKTVKNDLSENDILGLRGAIKKGIYWGLDVKRICSLNDISQIDFTGLKLTNDLKY